MLLSFVPRCHCRAQEKCRDFSKNKRQSARCRGKEGSCGPRRAWETNSRRDAPPSRSSGMLMTGAAARACAGGMRGRVGSWGGQSSGESEV